MLEIVSKKIMDIIDKKKYRNSFGIIDTKKKKQRNNSKNNSKTNILVKF